jgi:hypothetical protein
MEAPSQSLQQKIKAAQLHNRTHCPLARLPKDVQDHIAEYLEFNDRESDREVVAAINKIPDKRFAFKARTQYSAPEAVNIFVKFLNSRKILATSDKVGFEYSRDKSKIILAYQHENPNVTMYYCIYDHKQNKLVYAVKWPLNHGFDLCELLGVSNDGRYFSLIRYHKEQEDTYGYFETNPSDSSKPYHALGTIADRGFGPDPIVEFNKQATLCYDKRENTFYTLCSEQEHTERSKKTLALYLHQKCICKPFNYTQVNS